MDFGKLPSVDHIRFELPPDPPETVQLLERLRTPAPMRVYVGAPLWSCKEWVGKIYPPRTPAGEFLHVYSRQFNSIELNTTFYRLPETKTIESWRKVVPEGFRFAPKVWQQISHQLKLDYSLDAMRSFAQAVSGLGGTLGLSFLQFGPHFAASELPALARFLRALPRDFELALEFRHPSWFRERRLREDAFDLLASHGAATVITDVAGRRDVLHASLTSSKVLVRFVGNELHPSDFTRIDEWVERLAVWHERGVREVYFFIHHPGYINVPELANDLIRKLNARCGLGLDELRFDGGSGQLSLL